MLLLLTIDLVSSVHVASGTRSTENSRRPIWPDADDLVESIKTTSMEDVSTRVLEKIKNI